MSDPLEASGPVEASGPAFSLRALGSSAALLTVAGLMGQAFAVIRTLFIAARVGTAPELDALLVTEVVPLVVGGLLVSGCLLYTSPSPRD